MNLSKIDFQGTPKRKHERQNTITSMTSKSIRKFDVQTLDSGLQLILNETVLKQLDSILSGQAIEIIKDHMIRYLKHQGFLDLQYKEIFSKLRPVDIHILCEYCYLINQFTQMITIQDSPKRPLICNILLDLYFNDNPKFMKFAPTSLISMKRAEKDLRKLNKWLHAHKEQLNFHEVEQILRWAQKDYFNHYQLFHFQSHRDEGALDIVYLVVVEVPEPIPPLVQANFIPQQIQNESDQDSQEEDLYAYKISFMNQKKNDTLEHNEQVDPQLSINNVENNKVQAYIDTKLLEAQNELDLKLNQHSKQFNDSYLADKSKNIKK